MVQTPAWLMVSKMCHGNYSNADEIIHSVDVNWF